MRELFHPRPEDLDLATVLHALSDPNRLAIVEQAAREEIECACRDIELDVSAATASHHYRVLREAGVTRTRTEGRMKYISLRRADLDARFPGLLDGILASLAARR